MPKETVRLLLLLFLLLLLCTFSTGLNNSSEERQTLYILAMVPFPDPEKPAWARPDYDAAHSLLPAAQLAVDQINNRSDVLQDYNLELLEGDSGCEVVTTTYVSQVEQILYSGKTVIGIVGPACSEAALSVAALEQKMNLDVIHVTTGSVPLLDDRAKYPNTFGIISSSTAYVDVIFQLMNQSSWVNVAVLYDLLRPYYIETFKVFQDQLKDYCKEAEANITFSGGITETFLPLQEISTKGTRVIVVMSSMVPARKLFCLAAHKNMTFPAYQFVFQDRRLEHFITEVNVTQGSETYTCTREMMMKAIEGSILLHFGLTSVTNETVTVSQLTVEQVHDEYQKRLQQRREELNMTLNHTDFAYAFYDAVWAMALSINTSIPLINETWKDNMLEYDSPLFPIIREQFYNLKFQGATVTVKFDNQTGRVSSFVDVHQVESNDTLLIKEWNGTHLVNIANTTGEFIEDSFNSTTVLLHPAIAAVGLLVSTLAFLLTAVFQVINIAYCECKSIKASSPRLNHMIFSGCYLITAAVFINTIQVAFLPQFTSDIVIGSVICNVFAWCLNIGYTLVLATILVKLWRLNYVFLNSFKKQFLTDEVLVIVVIVILTLEIVLCIAWAAYTPLVERRKTNLTEENGMPVVIVKLQCESKESWFIGIIVGYEVVVTAVVLYFSIRNRHIKMRRFRNTRSINALLFSLALLWGFGGPLWLILGLRQAHLNILYSVSALLLTSTALLSLIFIFLPPIIHLLEERCRRRKFSQSTWRKLALFGLDPLY